MEKYRYFLGKTWSFIDKILKFQGEIQVFPGEIERFLGEIFHYFSQKRKIQLIMEKVNSGDFSFSALYVFC